METLTANDTAEASAHVDDARQRAMEAHPTNRRFRRRDSEEGSLTAEYGLVGVGAATCVGVLINHSDNLFGNLLSNVVSGIGRILGIG